MGEGLELFIKDWGPASLVSFFVLSIGLGLLIPRWSMNKTIKILDDRITEALAREKIHVSTNQMLQETLLLQTKQLGDLMEQSKTTVALVGSIEKTATRTGRHHGEE